MEPVIVENSKEWIEKAEKYAESAGYPSMKTGKLAEYAVIHYLRKEGVPLREDQTPTDKSDYFDINLGNTLVDVKSCLEPKKELRVTKGLFDRGRRFAFYIGVQVSRDRTKCKIYGFCSRDDVSKSKTRIVGKRKCYVIGFSKLQKIEKLVKSFAKNR